MMGFGFGNGGSNIIFWIAVILLTYYIHVNRGGEKSLKKETYSLEILKNRYSVGKMTRDEFPWTGVGI
jgi:uncharacterized membrane protein